MGQLKFDITGDNSNVLSAFRGVQDGVKQTAQIVEQQGQSIENVFNRIKSVASVAFAGFTAKEIVSTLANVRGEFQQLEIAFSTMLGSEQKATDLMKQLTNLAATTPFDMKGVASGAKSLLAYGFSAEEVTDTMRRLGDVCAGLGLNLQDMAWLYGTTRVQGRLFTQDFRQFTGRGIPLAEELAKQFGVTKDKVQELVTAGKVGFPEVQKAIESLTNEGGKFGGLMEKQSHSITGQISNIEDTIEMAINDLGTQTEGIMNDALDITSAVIDHWKEIGEVILTAASSIGLYKAMAVGIASFETASTGLGYEAELSALQSILPLKEEEKKTDLEEAVAKGQLSAAQAELVATKREEAAAYVASLQQEALATQQAYVEATNRAAQAALDVEAANEKVEACQQAYDEAIRLGAATSAESAEEALNTATVEANAAAKNLQAAREDVTTAAKARDTAATTANTAEQALNTAATARDTASKGLWAQVTALCQKAQVAWNASMFASPLFWIAAAIAGATYAVYKLVTAETAHEEAVRKTNEAWEQFDDDIEKRQSKIENLIRTIQSETSSEYEKAEAYQKLTALAPQLTEQYDQATLASSDFAKVQKEVSESMDDEKYEQAIQNVEELRKKVESLSMTSQSVAGYTMGGSSNTRAYEEAQEELAQAEEVLHNIITLRDQAAENAKPIEVRLKEAQENEQVRQNIFDFYDEAMTLANDWQVANETINYATGETRLDEFINKAEKEISDLRADIKKNPADLNLRMQEEEKTKCLNNLLAMKDNWKATGATTIPLIFKANWQSAQQSLNQAKSKASALANGGSTETYAQAYTKAQKEYRDAQKKVASMQKNKSAYSATDYETASNNLKTAKDAFAKLGGDVSGKSAKAAATAQKNRTKEENKEKKAQEELNKDLKSLQQKNLDEEISLMKEGTEKKLKEIDNDYKKRKAEIDKQESEFKKKNKEAGKKGDLTKEQSDALSQARNLAKQDYDKKVSDVNKDAAKEELQALNDYLKEYGTIQQQKYAIAKEYDDKITLAQGENQKKLLEAQKKQALDSMDAKNFALDIDWTASFKNVGNVLRDVAKETLSKVEAYMKTSDFKNLSATDKKTYTDLRNQLKTEQGDASSPFKASTWDDIARYTTAYQNSVKSLIAANEDHEQAVKELEQAEKELKSATSDTAYETAKAKVKAAQTRVTNTAAVVTNAQNNKDDAQQNLTDATDGAAQGLDNFSKVLNNITSGSLSGFVKGVVGIVQSLSGSSKELGSAFGELGGKIGGLVGAILSIIEALGDDPSNFIDQLLDKVINVIDGLMSQLASGKLIETLIEDIGKLVLTLIKDAVWETTSNALKQSTFGAIDITGWIGGGNGKKVQEAISKLTDSNEHLEDSINRLKTTMEKTYGQESKKAYEEAKRQQEQKNENLKEIAKQQASYHGSHKSWNHYWGGFSSDEIQQIQEAIGKSFNGDIWSLDENDMNTMLGYQWFTDKIRNTGAKHNGRSAYGESVLSALQDYADAAGTVEELTDDFKESLTQVSFDSMKESFISNLMDMTKSAEDFSDDFAEMMQKALLSYSMEDLLNGDLQELYDDWAKAIDDSAGELSEAQINEFNQRYDDIVAEGLKRRDEWSKVTGYTGESSQSATSGGWSEMGQDTADELNGRFTALQIAGESIAQNMADTVSQMQSIVTLGISTNGAVLEIRNMMIMTNSYLEDMVKYAKLTYNDFGTKMDDMYKRLKEI